MRGHIARVSLARTQGKKKAVGGPPPPWTHTQRRTLPCVCFLQRFDGALIGDRQGLQRYHPSSGVAAELTIPPSHESPAQVFGVDLQQVADVLERKRPRPVVGTDPLFRIEEQLAGLP